MIQIEFCNCLEIFSSHFDQHSREGQVERDMAHMDWGIE